MGYEFGNWTAARLSTHLEKETGISLSSSQIRKILKAKKYDPEKRKLFKAKLTEYLKITITKESPERLQLWFWDERWF
ncbi:MAG: winged helix-turn-helix domain-containing protein [Hormoscilla sp. GUM202]|nr:winged helix-turn-helix domain-containing protein [Hormoscilla sp. GUM202]